MATTLLSDFHKPKRKYRAFASYWQSYGRLSALLDSQWLWLAALVTLFLYPLWSKKEAEFDWVSVIFSTIPSLLGFSIGSVSILLAFSIGPKKALHKMRGSASYYLKMMASFFHFILLQFLAVGCGLFLMAYPSIYLSGIAFFVYAYALFSGVAAAAMLFSIAEIYDKSERLKESDSE